MKLSKNSLLLLLILAAAVLLRLVGVDRGIWYDELSSILVATSDDFIASSRAYDHPPLFFLILRHWAYFSDSTVWFRLLSVLFSFTTILVFVKWVQLLDKRAVLPACLIACCLPGLLSFSQEIRHYSLLVLMIVTCLYFLEKNIQAQDDRSFSVYGIWFSLFFVLAVSTHLIAIFLIPGVIVYCFLKSSSAKQVVRQCVFILPAIVCFALFYLWYLEARSHSYELGWWMPKPSLLLIGSNIAELVGLPQMSRGVLALPTLMYLPALSLLFLCIGLFSWAISFGNFKKAIQPLILFLVAYTAIAVYSYLFISVLISRTVLFLVLPLAASVAILIGSIGEFKRRIIANVCLFVLCVAGSLHWVYVEAPYERVPWTAMTEVLEGNIEARGNSSVDLSGYPFDAVEMLKYKTKTTSIPGKNFVTLEDITCEVLSTSEQLFYVFHDRKFMPERQVTENKKYLEILNRCYSLKKLIFDRKGLRLYSFSNT